MSTDLKLSFNKQLIIFKLFVFVVILLCRIPLFKFIVAYIYNYFAEIKI